MPTTTAAAVVPMLIGGRWVEATANAWEDVYNPSTGTDIARVPLAGREAVDEAVEAAAKQFRGWAATPVVERARVMFRFRGVLEQHFEELATLITREHGKTLAEARA